MNPEEVPHQHGEPHERELLAILERADNFQAVATIFKHLSDTTRVRIFWLLYHREECVTNLSALLSMSSPAVSHHLRPLKDAGLIVSRREGKEVHYRAADSEEARLLHRMIEEVMQMTCPDWSSDRLAGYPPEQVQAARAAHDYVMAHLDERVTIDELAKRFLVNPTTLKAVFKAIYGTSLATHMNEHRMERAAELLLSTGLTVGEIAREVGYDSQSKFSAAFKEHLGMVPTVFRKEGRKP